MGSASLIVAERESLDGDALDLEKEHTRLFLDPLGAPCPPWQSVHGHEPQLMGEAHHQALSWYRRFGVEPRAAGEPSDHVGLLLNFYAHLVLRNASAEDLCEFRAQHIDWIPGFCESVARVSRHPFFAALAKLTKCLVEGPAS